MWEAVGAATKNRLNVARIDKDTTGSTTARRFNVQKAPEFILYVDLFIYAKRNSIELYICLPFSVYYL